MFERVVICTDLTPGSDEIVGCAASLKSFGMREVLLAHVLDVFSGETGTDAGASEKFTRQTEVLESEGFNVRVDAPVGHPSHAIEEAAERENATMIVMGVREIAERQDSTSVSSGLIDITRRPVLLAPYGALSHPGSGRAACARLLSHVLFPTDLCEAGERALRGLEVLARRGISHVTVLHVLESEREGCGAADGTERQLRELGDRLGRMGVGRVTQRVEYGSPADTVLDAANSEDYSMVVAAAPRAPSLTTGRTGSVSSRLVAEGLRPMLIIPARCRWPMAQAPVSATA